MNIFISGPYGNTNPKEVIAKNVAMADKVARDLMAKGHNVFCPHKMSHGWEDDNRITLERCYELDRSFLLLWADAIIRIPGYSIGADKEMVIAVELGLEIYTPEELGVII
jgi:hypothetical protein